MKFRNLLYAMCAATLVVGCSDSDDLGVIVPSDGNSFISVNVALPAASGSTRAGEGAPNDNFADGLASEYAVDNLHIIVFDGTTDEAKVTKVHTVHAAGWNTEGSDVDNVTTVKQVGPIEVPTADICYVLVIANSNSMTLPTVGETYGNINTAMTAAGLDKKLKDKGFFMSNAPIKETAVGINDIITLVKCTPQITPALASATASTIYIERIHGKVEVKHATSSNWSDWTYTVPSGATPALPLAGDQIEITDWALDITNKSTYPVRKVLAAWFPGDASDITNWRASTLTAGGNRFFGTETNPIRTYYAVDPNYDTDMTLSDCKAAFNYKEDEDAPAFHALSGASATTFDYCLENTFDLARQVQGQTTRVVLKSTYTKSGATLQNLYRTESKIIYTQAQMETLLKSTINTHIKALPTTATVKFDLEEMEKAGLKQNIKSVSYTDTDGTQVVLDDTQLNIIKNEIGKLDFYIDGVCYYVARIKHFGDTLTPWTTGAYGVNEKDYLGRYGVVRNNWYELTFNTINNGPGEPVIPEVEDPDGPDDVTTYYIDCKINILAWAKRAQGVDL